MAYRDSVGNRVRVSEREWWKDARDWFYYPILIPLTADDQGPAEIGHDAVKITFEVWDQFCDKFGSFEYLPDAINEAMRLNDLHRAVALEDKA